MVISLHTDTSWDDRRRKIYTILVIRSCYKSVFCNFHDRFFLCFALSPGTPEMLTTKADLYAIVGYRTLLYILYRWAHFTGTANALSFRTGLRQTPVPRASLKSLCLPFLQSRKWHGTLLHESHI